VQNRKSELQGLPSCLNQGTSWRAIGLISSADSVGETPTLQPAGPFDSAQGGLPALQELHPTLFIA
jgi:hypothetical protein